MEAQPPLRRPGCLQTQLFPAGAPDQLHAVRRPLHHPRGHGHRGPRLPHDGVDSAATGAAHPWSRRSAGPSRVRPAFVARAAARPPLAEILRSNSSALEPVFTGLISKACDTAAPRRAARALLALADGLTAHVLIAPSPPPRRWAPSTGTSPTTDAPPASGAQRPVDGPAGQRRFPAAPSTSRLLDPPLSNGSSSRPGDG
ncbi:TetR family transcriptional regulator C-terminal domain-containing protein [Streptomyces sp. NPDC056411]|uniref:TetR family transcriptional regulator C-terminal domain-containing protein n=1 Tax=Streptomyces sp. NPDC056411 TaxID=3345813 RepID=UPI0035E3833B